MHLLTKLDFWNSISNSSSDTLSESVLMRHFSGSRADPGDGLFTSSSAEYLTSHFKKAKSGHMWAFLLWGGSPPVSTWKMIKDGFILTVVSNGLPCGSMSRQTNTIWSSNKHCKHCCFDITKIGEDGNLGDIRSVDQPKLLNTLKMKKEKPADLTPLSASSYN